MQPDPKVHARPPSWSGLFPKGDFEWALRMRRADPVAFFGPTDGGGGLLELKSEILGKHADRHLALAPEAEPLLEGLREELEAWVPDLGAGAGDFPALTRQLEPDFLVLEQPSQRLIAASVCFPSSWEPTRWIGEALTHIHDVVPRLNPQIGPMIDRFLRQLRPGKAFQRANWSLTVGNELNFHPALKRSSIEETTLIEDVCLRLEHQIFTTVSGAILMGIRIEPVPLKSLSVYPVLWQQILEKLETMPENVARYKNLHRGLPAMVEQMRGE